MSLRLILVRHAKSSWGDPGLDDHDRPLNGRGRRSATAIGHWLKDKGYLPARVLSSTSTRTRETWARLAEAARSRAEVAWLPELYHADAEAILAALRGAGTASPVLLLGHNPGIGDAAGALARVAPRRPKFAQYPTAATTVYDFDIAAWDEARWGGGTVTDFVVPRELGVN